MEPEGLFLLDQDVGNHLFMSLGGPLHLSQLLVGGHPARASTIGRCQLGHVGGGGPAESPPTSPWTAHEGPTDVSRHRSSHGTSLTCVELTGAPPTRETSPRTFTSAPGHRLGAGKHAQSAGRPFRHKTFPRGQDGVMTSGPTKAEVVGDFRHGLVVRLRLDEGLTYREISERAGLSVSQCHRIFQEARARRRGEYDVKQHMNAVFSDIEGSLDELRPWVLRSY